MNSVDNLTIEMLDLSDDNKLLIEVLHLPLDEIALTVRHGYSLFSRFSIKQAIRHEFRENPSKREDLKRLYTRISLDSRRIAELLSLEIYLELDRLGMIREFNQEQFQLSANIIALRHMLLNGAGGAPLCYHQSDKYLFELIRSLDNKSYETWQGYSEDTIEEIRKFLKKYLSDTEYEVIRMGFGLDDGICKDWQTIAKHFGWKSNGAITYHERKAAQRLSPIINEFKELTKIS